MRFNVLNSENFEEGTNNKFSALVGNPPYTVATSEGTPKSVYPSFFELGYVVADKSSIISPARWFNSQKDLVKIARTTIAKNDLSKHFRKLFFEDREASVFPNVEIKGGISWYLYDNNYSGDTEFVINGVEEGERPLLNKQRVVDSDRNLTTLRELTSDYEKIKIQDWEWFIRVEFIKRGLRPSADTVLRETSPQRSSPDDRRIRIPKHGWRFLPKGFLTPSKSVTPDGKYAMVFTHASSNAKYSLNDRSFFLSSGESAKATMAVILDTPQQVYNFYRYARTKFFCVLVSGRISSHNTYPQAYQDIPAFNFDGSDPIDWSLSIPLLDKALEKYFGLEEVHDYIQSTPKPFAAVPEEEYLEKWKNLGIDVSDAKQWYEE